MSKADRLKARLPRGFADRGPADLAATQRMVERIRAVYELYGFEALETPFVEYTETLGKFLPDLDRPNEGVFSFQDDDEQWLSLRYDLTAPLARHVAAKLDEQSLTLPYRSYRAGWVFRNEKPGPGRFRQFMQFDADTVGTAAVAADAEICMMAADAMEAVGIPRGQYVIKVNNRKILDGVMEAIGLGGEENAGRRLTVLRAIDKLDRLGPAGVRQLLGEGRKDESGDFTKGANLPPEQIDRIIRYTELDPLGRPTEERPGHKTYTVDNLAIADELLEEFGESELAAQGVEELRSIAKLTKAAGYEDHVIRIDPSVVRGLEYYTGPVYEAELTFAVENEQGQPVRFGSVAGGGRYDGLVGRFRQDAVPATGFSIGVSRLLSALQAISSPIAAGHEEPGPVVVLVMDRERVADYGRMVATLRRAGIRTELYLGSAGMKPQMKYADRRRSPCVVIQGSNEKADGTVQIKDLRAGAEQARQETAASNAAYRAARFAQVTIPEGQLVEAVREILARTPD